jgi:hypothetical protein
MQNVNYQIFFMRADGFHNICLPYCGEKLKMMFPLAAMKSLTNSKKFTYDSEGKLDHKF